MKRFLSVLLAVMLVCQTMTPVLADTKNTAGNTMERNQTILEKLNGMEGDEITREDVTDELFNMGLLDEKGMPVVSEMILVDGTLMTLEQVENLIYAEDADLAKTVYVDDIPVTLEDLKTMIEIEEELARIRETYFSGEVPIAEEHEPYLKSLVEQIESEGVSFQQTLMGSSGIPASGPVINQDARIQLVPSATVFENDALINLTFALVDKNGSTLANGLDYDVSFKWRLRNGSARKDELYWTVSEAGLEEEGEVIIPAGDSAAQARIAVGVYGNELFEYGRWNGDKTFLLQAYDPENILFYQNASESDARSVAIPVTLRKAYNWVKSITKRVDFANLTLDDLKIKMKPNAQNFSESDKSAIKSTIEDVFGGIDNAKLEFYPWVKMTCESGSYTLSTKPLLLDEDGYEISNAQYQDFNTGTYYPYDALPVQTQPINTGEGRQYSVKFSGAWPGAFAFMNPSISPYYSDSQVSVQETDLNLRVIDREVPRVVSITAPVGTYYSGQTIPITVKFSEPVRTKTMATGDTPGNPSGPTLTLTVKEGESEEEILTAQESSSTISKYMTFLYTVPDEPGTDLIVSAVNHIQDMAEVDQATGEGSNTTDLWPEDGHQTTIAGVAMEQDPLLAFESLSLVNPPEGGYQTGDTMHVRLDVDKDFSLWLENEYDTDRDQLSSVYLIADDTTFPLRMGGEGAEEGSYYTSAIAAADSLHDTGRTLQIDLCMDGEYEPEYMDPNTGFVSPGHFRDGIYVIGMSVTANLGALVFAADIDLDESSYPADGVLYLTDPANIVLKASVVPGNANFKTIQWSSSDPTVATIDAASGQINPVSTGTVSFSAIVQNGSSGSITRSTPLFTVAGGGSPALMFADGSNAFYTKKDEAVKVSWKQNLIGRVSGVPMVFNVEVYEGNFTDESQISGAPVYSTAVSDESSCTIPGGELSMVSNGTEPAYTVKVSGTNPDNGSVLSAIGYVIVYPQPVKAVLTSLQSYYITDETDQLSIGWTLSNYESGGPFELKILKNQTEIYRGLQSSESGNHYALSLADVPPDALRDVYTVSVKAKNPLDASWSADSFLLYVYNQAALKILVDGQSREAVTMDNDNYIKTLYQQGGSAAILDLGRDIGLKNAISINYGEYAWGNVTDQIQWASEDSSVASVSYKQGNLYENIERFSYSKYRPSTEFMLTGHGAGSTEITATHALTGMQDTLNVDVKTLKDKLYIFNFYPKRQTTLTYTNGDGAVRTLESNSNGEIAVYEERGIASDIILKSGDPSDLYLGTLYKEKLISSEGDAGLYELYPLNLFELRPAAKVALYFKNADGTPYTGRVAYGGAVYKNGGLCAETLKNSGTPLQLGPDGRFNLNLDATTFWVESNSETFTGRDKLEFIYEVLIDGYYPQLIKVNGNISIEDVVRFGESVVNLKPVIQEDRNKPFVAAQAIDYKLAGGRTLDVTNYTGSVGPGNLYPTADLLTTAAWWGSPKEDGYDIKVEDEYGAVIDGQRVKTILYPFATMAYTQNVTLMSENSMNLGVGEKKGAELSLYLPDGKLARHVQSTFTFTNMVGAPGANDSEKGVEGAVKDINESGDLKFDMSNMAQGDQVIGVALEMMSGTSLGGQIMNLMITPTEDPSVYHGLITMKQGLGETEDIPDVEIGFRGFDDPEAGISVNPNDIINPAETMKDLEETMEKAVSGGVDYGVSITGYFEVEIRYDVTKGKWIMVVLGGGFDLDGLIGYTWKMNQMVGPVPLTAEFGLGAQGQLSFRATKPYGTVPEGINAADVNDFLTGLRVNIYMRAFGGFGFDYSIIALKIGVFGQVNAGYTAEFLNRSYLAPPPEGQGSLYATVQTLSGQVGIKFVAKFVFFSYEAVLASGGYSMDLYQEGNPELIEEWKQSQNSSIISASTQRDGLIAYLLQQSGEDSLLVVHEGADFESRDYLERYDRTWKRSGSGLRSLQSAGTQGATDIQSNSYPYANPAVTRDGKLLAYLSDGNSSDLNETRASWAEGDNGVYTNRGAIAEPSGTVLADSNLKLDGDQDFAVAAWERQGVRITTEGGVTTEDISAMLNSSDIMASIYNGGSWSTVKLTENLVPDLSPVVAADGGRAIVVWRSVAGSDMNADAFNYDDVNDSILYKTYDGTAWSQTDTLYNGSSGNVKAVTATIMEDGTAAVAYTLDCGTTQSNPAYGYETFCAVIAAGGELNSNLRLSNDDAVDENPQMITANFETSTGTEDEKFVLGWYHAANAEKSDIRLAAVNKNGVLYDGFVDTLGSTGENSKPKVTSTFRFAKGENMDISDLSLLWVEPSTDYDSADEPDKNASRDSLKAVKFFKDTQGRYCLTGVQDVAAMDPYTLIDHFDAYSPAAKEVRAVLLTSSYTGVLQDEGNDVYTVDAVSSMKFASAEFKNAADVTQVYLDYNELRNDFSVPIQFTVENRGVDPISSIEIKLSPDNVVKTFGPLNLLPGQMTVLTINYDVPGASDVIGGMTGIHDVDYIVTASFNNATQDQIIESGSLNLDVPDTGFSKVELISDEQGRRVFQAILQNLSDIPLAEGSGRKVYAGFYRSPEYEEESKVEVRQINGDDLALLDDSALTMRFTYTLPAAGIPSGGTRLYGKIWVEELQQDGSYAEVTEYEQNNNKVSIHFPNPIEANNGKAVLVNVDQENNADVTTAYVTVKNLSMKPIANGNVTLQLLDSSRNVIETKLLGTAAQELLSLAGEERTTRSVVFSRLGTKIRAEYYTADPGSMASAISDISLSGIRMDYNELVTDYVLAASNLGMTTVTAAAKNLQDRVLIKDLSDNQILASGTGAVSYTLPLSGSRTSTLQVMASNAVTQANSMAYNLSISSAGSSAAVTLDAESPAYQSVTVAVKADHLMNFTPVKWQYRKNGVWSEVFDWNSAENHFDVAGAGAYTVSVRLLDKEGYYIDSGTKYIEVLRSGGSSSGSSSRSSEQEDIVQEKVNATATLLAQVSVDAEGMARVSFSKEEWDEAVRKCKEARALGEKVTLKLAVNGLRDDAKGIAFNIPKEILVQLAEETEISLLADTGMTTAVFDDAAINSIAGAAGGDICLDICRADTSGLPEQTRIRIGGRPVFDFSIKAGGQKITSFGRGTVQIGINYTPDKAELENWESIIVWYVDGSGKLVAVPSGHYNPAAGAVAFHTAHFSRYAVGCNPISFSDVSSDAWYSKAVGFIAARNITTGTGGGNYSPAANLTRGEFIVMLMKAYEIEPDTGLNNSSAADGAFKEDADNFADAGDTWYTGYLASAKGLGISEGVGNNLFAPGRPITRQELFALTYNALKIIERVPKALGAGSGKKLSSFSDAEKIASWAEEAMSLMAETGIVNGSGGRLLPDNKTTRAEMAQVLYHLMTN